VFGKTTRDAQSATSEYNTALEEQVGEIERVGGTGAVISELATIAKLMLNRTQEIERKINVSEKETRALQKNLEDARREAELDHLTGLPNRRAFEAVLKSEHEKATINQESLCVAFCDLDHFKRINDTHGHEAGDRVLRNTAQTLAKISNDRCHIARHGGEEFVVLFRGKSLDEAFAELDDTREQMSQRRMVNRKTDRPFGMITFSAGIADVSCYENPREALKAADDALYAAKNNGRNQIVRAALDEGRQAA
jgi:diguanylate cyclase